MHGTRKLSHRQVTQGSKRQGGQNTKAAGGQVGYRREYSHGKGGQDQQEGPPTGPVGITPPKHKGAG